MSEQVVIRLTAKKRDENVERCATCQNYLYRREYQGYIPYIGMHICVSCAEEFKRVRDENTRTEEEMGQLCF